MRGCPVRWIATDMPCTARRVWASGAGGLTGKGRGGEGGGAAVAAVRQQWLFGVQQAGFGGVLEIAIAGKPAPTGDVCYPRFCRSRLAGDGDFEYADVAGGFSCVLEIAIAGKPAPTGDVCGPQLRRSRLAGDGDVDYADVVNGCPGC
ncbi:hypothetical protein EMIT0P4_110044 [Pseudomonas sp. IT-P4]